MRYFENHPMIMIVIGIVGISLSSILVRFSDAPSAVTAAYRLLWTVLLMTPAVFGKKELRQELKQMERKSMLLSVASGIFLASHFVLWFESLRHTSVASSTTIVCTEVIWVSIGFCALMGGKLSSAAMGTIGVTLLGSAMIAFSDSGSGSNLYGDMLSLLAAIAVAAYTLIGRMVRKSASTGAYTYVVYAACAAVLCTICAMQGLCIWDYGFRACAVGFLLAVFSTLLGHSIFSWCLKYFSPSFVSASKLCEPVAAGLMAALLFGEIPKLLQLVGGALILGGVYAYSRIERSV